MLVSAVSFNDWNFVGGPVDPLRLKISEQQQYLKKKLVKLIFLLKLEVLHHHCTKYLDRKKKKKQFLINLILLHIEFTLSYASFAMLSALKLTLLVAFLFIEGL